MSWIVKQQERQEPRFAIPTIIHQISPSEKCEPRKRAWEADLPPD
jgi:hypothetical protein